MRTLTKELQDKISPQEALKLLRQGNQRFVQNLKVNRNLLQQANDTSDGQHPFATIISCMDSRTSAELIFDQGLGDIFSIRIAGNIINEDILGSCEFATKVVGTKIILVLGHTSCGAINGAIGNVQLGHLTQLTDKVKKCFSHCSDAKDVTIVTKENVIQGIRELRTQSPILDELEKEGKITIAGGVYDISTGMVEFFQD